MNPLLHFLPDPLVRFHHRPGPSGFIFFPDSAGQFIEHTAEMFNYFTGHAVSLLDFVIKVWILRNNLGRDLQLCIKSTARNLAQQRHGFTALRQRAGEGDIDQVRQAQYPGHDFVVLFQAQIDAFCRRVGEQRTRFVQGFTIANIDKQDVAA